MATGKPRVLLYFIEDKMGFLMTNFVGFGVFFHKIFAKFFTFDGLFDFISLKDLMNFYYCRFRVYFVFVTV